MSDYCKPQTAIFITFNLPFLTCWFSRIVAWHRGSDIGEREGSEEADTFSALTLSAADFEDGTSFENSIAGSFCFTVTESLQVITTILRVVCN